ncbi:chorismate mutase [Streptomyces sp. NA02950]|uniref:chorismate mutase n=1 Tax=Streptomyces sp. NA02950 TaxID=2742137 RepID=UPI001591F883|nr:chorismate mutase [Streptomyces sp. NA02950]QKV91462.1 chorismate mutase [Streptomyces sp. NA02950]
MNHTDASELEEQQAVVDDLDRAIAALVQQRSAAARQLGKLRGARGVPRSELARENGTLLHYRTELGPLGNRLGLLLLEMARDASRE